MKKYAIKSIWQHSNNTAQPIYIIIDDTVNEKTVPSSKAQRKIELAQIALKEIPKPVNKGYVLADSWYSCEALFTISRFIGFQYIGALKSNRKIFPRGYKKDGIKISDFIKMLKQHELDVVTVGGKTYYTYTYLGKINGFKKVKIIMSWPQKA